MQVYNYNPITREFVGTEIADPNPLVEGEWLIPAHATTIEPPEHIEGSSRVFDGDNWHYVEHEQEEQESPEEQEELPEPVKNIIEAPTTLFGGPTLKEILYGN